MTKARGKLDVSHVESTFVQNTVVNLTHNDGHKIGSWIHPAVTVEVPCFTKELRLILKRSAPDVLGIERYQGRGIKGKTGESVNMMIGLVLDRATSMSIPWRLYTAALWKNWANRLLTPRDAPRPKGSRRYMPIEEVYSLAKVRGVQPHSADTVCMALWLFEQETGEGVSESDLLNAIRRVEVT